jgi:pimeloyl-ACP methyl ester carboxylesterase
LAIGVAAYFGLLAILYVSQRDLLYYPNDIVPDPAAHGVPEMAVHRVEPEAGIQPLIWWAPPKNPSLPVIVYFHGNGGHLGSRAGRARIYLKAGYGLLLAGYRYNAGAGGEASEDGLLADARAAVAFARARGYEPARMVFYGESLGAGVATAMAAEYPAAALVLDSAYSSIADVAQAAGEGQVRFNCPDGCGALAGLDRPWRGRPDHPGLVGAQVAGGDAATEGSPFSAQGKSRQSLSSRRRRSGARFSGAQRRPHSGKNRRRWRVEPLTVIRNRSDVAISVRGQERSEGRS